MGGIVNQIGGMFGEGANGSQTTASAANVVNPITGEQLAKSYTDQATGLNQQQNLQQLASTQGGFGNQTGILGQQQVLANQLQAQALGQGPNPSQIQFGQNLDAASKAAAGGISSQKGISPALAAQLISQQQGAAGQNAAASSAGMQAQQQLAAQQQLGQQQAQMQNVAQAQIGNQSAATNAYAQGAQNQQGNLLSAVGGYNNSNVNAQNSAQNANMQLAGVNANNSSRMIGTTIFGKGYAEGGEVKSRSKIPDHLMHHARIFHPHLLMMAEGGQADIFEPEVDQHSFAASAKPALVPGEPTVDHNSYKNDTVPAMLSPGEIVIPLDVLNSKDPIKSSAKFVQTILNKKDPIKDKENFNTALKEAVKNRKRK